MIKHIETINQILDKEKKISKKQLDEAIQKVDMEEDIKIIENIIDTLKFHIEYENYEENILDECKRDIKALENLLKRI